MNAQTRNNLPQLYEIEIEQMLIGAVMVRRHTYWPTESIVSAEDFYDPFHQAIWAVLADRVADDKPTDARMIIAQLRAQIADLAAREDFDAESYLHGVCAAAPASCDMKACAQTIADLARRRRIVQAADDARDAAFYDRETQPDQIADRAGEGIYEAAHRDEPGRGTESLSDVATRAAQMADDARRNPAQAKITTGLSVVDKALGGLFPRDVTVLGAPPNIGKSGLVGQISLSAAMAGYRTVMFSKEMASEEFATRFLAADAQVPSNRITEGRTSEAEVGRLAEAAVRYGETPYHLDGSSNLTVAQMRARTQAVRRRHGDVSLVVIDHLRFIRAEDRRADFTEQMQQVTRDLKAMAKEMSLSVLLVAHLNREFWKRVNHKPLPSDLYGASAIEQNADHIWFLHREEFFLEREEPTQTDDKAYGEWAVKMETARGWAELYSAKRRGGPLGSAKLKFDAPYVRFKDPDDGASQGEIEGLL